VGALLAAAGAIHAGPVPQSTRDPALVGVSSGGALAATSTIVVGDRLGIPLPFELLPIAAFVGALSAPPRSTALRRGESRTSARSSCWGGSRSAALANAGIGLLVFVADDRQLRDITFWMLGSLGGATWPKTLAIAPFAVALIVAVPLIARGLDLLVLGEAEAFHMGVEVERLKRYAIPAGLGDNRRSRRGRGRDRLRRHRGAPPVAAHDRARPSPAAASLASCSVPS